MLLSKAFDLGIPGVQVSHGDHLCALYSDEKQRDDVLIPFLRAGLAAGDKCIGVVDEPADVTSALGAQLDATVGKQLDLIRPADMYLRSGGFAASEVISCWKASIAEVMYDGRFNAVRAIETWSSRDVVPDAQELLLLESEMNRYLPLYPQVIVCMYDVGRFGGSVIVDLLRTHPRMLLGATVLENPYYVPPDEVLADGGAAGRDAASVGREEMAAWCYDVTTGST